MVKQVDTKVRKTFMSCFNFEHPPFCPLEIELPGPSHDMWTPYNNDNSIEIRTGTM